jgi:FkbH-like protein
VSKEIKCLIWDLDNTLWNGTLAEDAQVELREGAAEVVAELDRRGILQSVASRNHFGDAMDVLRRMGLDGYFLYPQISWGNKSAAVREIAKELNIGLDSLAFIDDEPTERTEVTFHIPEVLVIDAQEYLRIPDMEAFKPKFVTADSALRRRMYIDDMERRARQDEFEGPNEEFLKTLDMELSIAPVRPGDLERVYELTVRTNQLNSTGVTYDFEELSRYIDSEKHVFLIAGLSDKFGPYGKIGLALLEESDCELCIKLLLMSCRVLSKGVGSALLVLMTQLAAERGKTLAADFVDTGRNRMMYLTYKFMGFEEANEEGTKLAYKGGRREYPDYFRMIDASS